MRPRVRAVRVPRPFAMRGGVALVALIGMSTLAACGGKDTPAPAVRPVVAATVHRSTQAPQLLLPATIQARNSTPLSFRLGGKIVERRAKLGAREGRRGASEHRLGGSSDADRVRACPVQRSARAPRHRDTATGARLDTGAQTTHRASATGTDQRYVRGCGRTARTGAATTRARAASAALCNARRGPGRRDQRRICRNRPERLRRSAHLRPRMGRRNRRYQRRIRNRDQRIAHGTAGNGLSPRIARYAARRPRAGVLPRGRSAKPHLSREVQHRRTACRVAPGYDGQRRDHERPRRAQRAECFIYVARDGTVPRWRESRALDRHSTARSPRIATRADRALRRRHNRGHLRSEGWRNGRRAGRAYRERRAEGSTTILRSRRCASKGNRCSASVSR